MLHHRTKTGFLLILLYLLFFLFFLPVAPVMAVDYYVGPSGADNPANGLSSTSPWKTLHHAIPRLATGGVLHVLPGTYSAANGEDSSSVGNPLTIAYNDVQILGDPSGGVILDGTNGIDWMAGLAVGTGVTGVIIEGLEIREFTDGIIVGQNAVATIQGCNIHNNTDGIQVDRSSPRIEKNNINDNSNGVSITANLSYTASPEILDNVFRDNTYGIYVYANGDEASPKIINNLIYEYVSTAMNYGIYIEGSTSMGINSSEIFHNTIDGGTTDGICLDKDAGPMIPSIQFNNITDFGGYGINDNGATVSSPTISYNNVYNNTLENYDPSLTGSVSNDINQLPQYNDSAGQDYHLLSTSPCRDAIPSAAGDPVIYDLDGVDRTLPAMGDKDIGCYEFLPDLSLNISISPSATGTVNGVGTVNTAPANCAADSCTWNYIVNESVQLTAAAATGYQFSNWDEGGTTRTANPDTIIMNEAKTITAFFTPLSYTFTVSIDGSGSVAGNGIACPGDCSESISFGTTVNMTAMPDSGYLFDHWEEDDGTIHTENPGSFLMDSDVTATAYFVPVADETFTLIVSVLPPGSGSVSDTGINCPGDCSETASSGSIFNLLAVPNTGFVFDRWEENGTIKTGNLNTLTLEKNIRVSAIFVSEEDASNAPPETPTAVAPADEDAFPDGTGSIALQTSAFSDPDGDSHAYTRWLVRREDRGFYFNQDYDSSFDYTATSSPDLTQHTVSGLASGMVYIWQAGYVDSRGKISWSEEYQFLVGDESPVPLMQIPPGVTARKYRMISFPIWSAASLCALLFDTSGGYDVKSMRIGTWDALSGSYIECDDGLKIKPGRAYWILARNGLDAAPSGIPVTTNLDVEIGLQLGWNMIASPNNRAYTWDDVEVLEADLSGGTVLDPTPIGNLTDTTYINPTLWRWENGDYAPDTPVMMPYEGYWVRANRENLFLKFSDSAVRTASRHSSEIISNQGEPNTISNLSLRKAAGAEDTPPMPMGIGSNTEKGGCFIAVFSY